KISELYDRVAFAAVGRGNGFEKLRLGGVRYADARGYAYDRRDVTGRMPATAYAPTPGTVFSESNTPWELEIVAAELGDDAGSDQIYRITLDGPVADEKGLVGMGGSAEAVTNALKERFDPAAPLSEALSAAMYALSHGQHERRELEAANLEVAILERARE